MTEPTLTKEGQEVLDEIVNTRPPIVRESRKQKYLRMLSFLMNEQDLKQADRRLVIETITMVESKALDPIFLRWEDPAKFKRLLVDPRTDVEACYALPVEVKRWDCPPVPAGKRPEEMKVLAFCASPRKGGNTEVLIDEAIRGVQDAGAKVEKFVLQKMKIGYCIQCTQCNLPGFEGFCPQKDDLSDIYPKIVDSDAIIIGFPIYTARECAQLATFMDRWRCVGKVEPSRRVMVIGTWGYPAIDTYDHMIERLISILHLHGFETVEALSACGFSGKLGGFDENRKAMVLRFPKELEKAHQAGKSLVTG
jgi:putative NADPH-quinone reductase